MMSEQTVQAAISIILNAGDARVACKEALDAISAFDFETAEAKLKVSHEKITAAHKVQTDAIQGETRGEAKGMIEICLDMSFSKEDILKKLQEKLNISLQQAGEYFEMYGKHIV